jgi:hypothetical protein
MPWVGFEPTISALKLAKTFHALDRMAIVIRIVDVMESRAINTVILNITYKNYGMGFLFYNNFNLDIGVLDLYVV